MWDLVCKVVGTLVGVIGIVTVLITLVTKSHDPLSRQFQAGGGDSYTMYVGFGAV